MFVRVVLMLLFAGAIFGGLAYTKYQQIQHLKVQFSAPQPPTKVATTTVRQVRWQNAVSGTGALTAVQDVQVTNEVPGLVAGIHFESGQQVNKGDVLVTLDTAVDQAVLNGLQAEERLANVQFERAAKLVRDHTMAQSQYDEAAARHARTAADVLAQQAQIAKKTIRAPFSGWLGIRRIALGQYLKAGSSIVPLQTLTPIYLDSALPERFYPLLKIGQEVRVRVQAYAPEQFVGKIAAIEPGIDPATRMVRVRAELANADQRLRPGMFAEVDAVQAITDEVLVLPDTAVTYSPYGNSVFVIEKTPKGATVTRRQIETGPIRDGQVAVLKGLGAGEQIVAVGQNKLRNGMLVEAVTATITEPANK